MRAAPCVDKKEVRREQRALSAGRSAWSGRVSFSAALESQPGVGHLAGPLCEREEREERGPERVGGHSTKHSQRR
ncbi:unnamed protein product [Merluccius merluccius]